MSNILMSAGSGGYIAGLVIELLIIAAAGVFIFLTLSGKLSKKAIAAGGDAPSEEEAAEEMLIQENVEPAAEAAGETDGFDWMLAPLFVSTLLVDRLAVHMEKYTGHDLDFRRYYRQFDY